MPLLPNHYQMLQQESAISSQVIQARGYQSVSANEAIKYGFQSWQARDGLLYPVNPPDGSNGLYQLRPDNPRTNQAGKPIKYEHPYGSPPRLDIPKSCHSFINDPTKPAIITEGVKKVDSLISNLSGDWLTINLCSGVYGWLKNKQPIADMGLIDWTGRHCYLIFDNDVSTKPSVRYALEWLSGELASRGATTSVVYLPENNGKKLGIDDWFSQGGQAGELLEMMRLSCIDIDDLIEEIDRTQSSKRIELTRWLVWRLADLDELELEVYLSLIKRSALSLTALRKQIMRRKAQFGQSRPTDDELRDMWLDKAPLTAYGLADWRRYDKGIWPVISEDVVKDEIETVIEGCKKLGTDPKSSLLSSVTELARLKVSKPDNVWDTDSDYLPCANGTLHIPTRTLEQHDPMLYFTSGVSYDYDPQAKAPTWTVFLFDLVNSIGQDVVDFLQEFAGYSLTTDTSHELSIWLHGSPGSGKSTFITGLDAMLGERIGLLGLADVVNSRFALANLPGKTLAISTEQPGDYIASTHILNALISGEPITVDRKFRDAIQVIPRCKLVWAMNDLPRVSDPNSGLFRRVKVVKFPLIPEANRDPQLKELVKTEGAGILNWALDGLDRLRKRGRFEIPQAVKDATQNFADSNDVPARFVEECCETGNDAQGQPYRVHAGTFYAAYKLWCIENGHKPQSSTRLANDWERLGFEKKRPGGIKYWFNVSLKQSTKTGTIP